MVDYMIWPWFERLDAINPYSNGTFVIPFEEKFPRLVRFELIMKLYLYTLSFALFYNFQTEWKSLMIADKAVAPYYITPEKHAEHFTKRKAGLPAYDI